MDKETLIRHNFGQRAAKYRNSQTHGSQDDLNRMLKLLQPSSDMSALDVATGGGHTAIKLASVVKKVVAIDITEPMLKEAQSAALEQGLKNIEFRLEDVHKLTFPDESFDIVASRFAPHHFTNIQKALFEMCRVLKNKGRLYILDCSVIDGDEPEKTINHVEWLRDTSHVFSSSKRLWAGLLAELPLQVEYMELLRSEYQIPQWFDRMDTPPDKREEIMKVLAGLSVETREHYPYNNDFITTYRIEFLAKRI